MRNAGWCWLDRQVRTSANSTPANKKQVLRRLLEVVEADDKPSAFVGNKSATST
jgi:hypothetical protein